MPDKDRSLHLARVTARVFGSVSADQAWTPAVNVYQCPGVLRVCVELAGVRREAISVSVRPGRLVIEGRRDVPEPEDVPAQCLREMEIDHGVFRRSLALPSSVALDRVESVYRDGLLWITLPIED
jgi:HSP20 family molecular chaperone IbpA